jgi:hypothetical protein
MLKNSLGVLRHFDLTQCRLPRLAFSPELVEGSEPALSSSKGRTNGLRRFSVHAEALEAFRIFFSNLLVKFVFTLPIIDCRLSALVKVFRALL